MRANYGKKLRNYFIHHSNPIFLFDFSWYQVFDSASVDSNILGIKKTKNQNKVLSVIAGKEFDINNFQAYVDKNAASMTFYEDNYWTIKSDDHNVLKRKLISSGMNLNEWDFTIYRGILTGLNEAFIIDSQTKDELINMDSKNLEIIKPLIRGRDVERFGYNFQELWLIFSRRGIDIDDYPTIKEYLNKYKIQLLPKINEKQNQGRKPGTYKWFEIQDNTAYFPEFDKEKLIWAETMRVHKLGDRSFPRFGYDITGIFPDKTVFIGVGYHLKYLLAFLNSAIGRWLIMEYVTKLDTGGYMMQKIFLDKIPIIIADENHENLIIELIDQILAAKKSDSHADTSALENEIDQLVYDLYGLTEEEKRIVEGE